MGFLLGSSGGGSNSGSNPALNSTARMARQLFDQTQPARTDLLADFKDPFDPAAFQSSPATNALQSIINAQFGAARDATIASAPAGGALFGALGELEGDRAGALASGLGQLYGQDKNTFDQQRFSAAFGTPATALGALGAAGSAQASAAATQGAADAGKTGELGQAAGTLIGLML